MIVEACIDHFETKNTQGNTCAIFLSSIPTGDWLVRERLYLPNNCWIDQKTDFGNEKAARAYFERIREGKLVRGYQHS